MRALKIAGAAIAAVIIVAALLLIIGIPSGFMTSTIQDRVERETGYRLTIAGATKIGVWPSLHVTLNDITLEDPQHRDTSKRLTVGSAEADVTLKSVWSGHPQITELAIVHPTVYVPLLRERTAAAGLEDEEDEEAEPDDRGEGGTKIVPRRPGEFLCSSCFLVLPRNQLADEAQMLCRDCV